VFLDVRKTTKIDDVQEANVYEDVEN